MRIGHGYDVHRFAENRRLVIGGVEIPLNRGFWGTPTRTCCSMPFATRCSARQRWGI